MEPDDPQNKKPKKTSKAKRSKPRKPRQKKIKPEPQSKKPEPDIDLSEKLGTLDPTTFSTLSSFFAKHEDLSQLEHKKRMKYMCANIEEYLSNFILIGYTVKGETVNVTCAKTQKDMDSLSTALQKYVFDCFNKYPPPPGYFE